MSDVLPADVEAIVDLASTAPSDLIAEMAAHGDERSFPVVGPAAGRALCLLAATAGARRVFEFGSGFGYSAAWFLGALPDDGEIVLTDYDPDNLATARSYLDRHDADATVHYEEGDALETFERYDGPFDLVFVDHDKSTYPETVDLVAPALADGALLIADNILHGPVDPAGVRATLAGGAPPDDATRGIAAYLERLRDDDAFDTVILPLGNGLAVSRYDP